jgi:hypothetical protein
MSLTQLIIIVCFAAGCGLWYLLQRFCARCDPQGGHDKPRCGPCASHRRED